MRQRLGIIFAIVLVIGALIAINSLAFVSDDEKQDTEISPNRSTYNARSTGTRALHDFLNESGYQVMRWREPVDRLHGKSGEKVGTFVIVGRPRIPIDEEEAKSLLIWVKKGGRLVLIDRRTEDYLLPPSGNWKITTELLDFPFAIDPTKPEQMIEGVKTVQPAQPTLLTQNVEAVMPSRFFAAIRIFPVSNDDKKKNNEISKANENSNSDDDGGFFDDSDEPPAPKSEEVLTLNTSPSLSPAPVVHLATSRAPLLVDYHYGNGTVTLLSDPFIVANNGIANNDNLQLAWLDCIRRVSSRSWRYAKRVRGLL